MDWETKKYPAYYGGVKQVYPNVAPGMPIFSRSAVVGNLIFLAGSAGRTLETGDVPSDKLEEQMVVALDKIKIAVEETGGSMNNVIKTLILLRDLEDYSSMRETELEYYQKHAPLLLKEPPASTVIQVGSLAKSHYRVEVDAVAVISRDRPGWQMKKYPLYYGSVKQPYSKSAVVGNLIFLAGMTGVNPDIGKIESDNLAKQTVTALDKVKMTMEEAGGSMENIVKTVIYLKNLEDYPRMREVELQYYQKHAPLLVEEPPASTFVQPRSLEKSEYLINIDAIGVISRDRPGWKVKKYPAYYGSVKQPYSRSVVVGNLIFLSGVTGVNPDNGKIESDILEEQVTTAFNNARFAMEEAGSSINNMIKLVSYLWNVKDYSRMRKAEFEYYQKNAPIMVEEPRAGTFTQPLSLASPEYLVGFDVIGVISRQGK